MKICKDCGIEKLNDEFYGIQGECKICTLKRVKKYRSLNIEKIREYDSLRNKTPERKLKALLYQQSQRKNKPEKYLARLKTQRAVASGVLKKKPCKICGSKNVQAHHPDYSKPLKVEWYCFKHHRNEHGQLK